MNTPVCCSITASYPHPGLFSRLIEFKNYHYCHTPEYND